MQCSHSIISASHCGPWNRLRMMVDRMSYACSRGEVISILTEGSDCAKVDTLVMRDKPLGYDLLIGIDPIYELGGIVIRPTGEVQLRRKHELCAGIMIGEQYFCTAFDHKKKAWTARWKWTGHKGPDQLLNTTAVYAVFNKSRAELETWIANG